MVDRPSSVGLVTVGGGYPAAAPFHPDESYPEYGSRPTSGTSNPVYRAVRDLLYRLGYDRARFGSPLWNPLGHLIAFQIEERMKAGIEPSAVSMRRETRAGAVLRASSRPARSGRSEDSRSMTAMP